MGHAQLKKKNKVWDNWCGTNRICMASVTSSRPYCGSPRWL